MKSKLSLAVVLLFLAAIVAGLAYLAAKLEDVRPKGNASARAAAPAARATPPPVASGAASVLTFVDEPEVEDVAQAKGLREVGVIASFKTSQRVFSRDGRKVAALVTHTTRIRDDPPKVGKSVRFLIDDQNWLMISLDDPQQFSSHLTVESTISASDDSITVEVPERSYYEIFFKSTGAFLDGADRQQMLQGVIERAKLAQ